MSHTALWTSVIIAAVGCYALKALGLSIPERVLDRPVLQRIADLLPIALLAGLVAVGAFALGTRLGVDARVGGLGAAVIALLLRAPFLVVVAVAAVTAALIRLVA